MFVLRSVRRLATIQKGSRVTTGPWSNQIEPKAVGMLRYMQNQTENLQKLPETTFGSGEIISLYHNLGLTGVGQYQVELKGFSGKINFIIMCEHQGRYQRCANWTLDLKNHVLNEHHIDELINASATITGKSN